MDCIQCGTSFEASEGSCPQCDWNVDVLFDPAIFRPGELIRGRYEFERSIGQGRLGGVFVARDLETDTDVAIKVIHHGLIPNDGVGREFMSSMRKLMRLDHLVMTKTLDVNCEADRYYVVSELLEGVPLRDLLDNRRAQGRSFNLREIYPIVRQITAFLIESGVQQHGALSPENVWILPQNLKVLDSGLVSSLPGGATGYRLMSSGRVRGYVAPELRAGQKPTPRTDVYSLGVLLGEMVTQTTFDGRAEMFHEVDGDLPEEIDGILRRALLRDPRGRFADAEEFLEDMARLSDAPPPSFNRRDPDTPRVDSSEPGEMKPAGAATAPKAAPPRAAPPRRAIDFGVQGIPEATMQVSMDDVIKAHLDNVEKKFAREDSGLAAIPEPESKPDPLRAAPPVRRSSVPPPSISSAPPLPVRYSSAPPPPPARRPSTPPPAARRSSSPPLPPPRRADPDEGRQPEFVSNFQAGPQSRDTIAPKRPSPRRSVPPPAPPVVAPPPRSRRADEPVEYDDEPTNVELMSAVGAAESPPRREVTQEIDMAEIEAVSQVAPRREVTQEIDASMIQMEDPSSMQAAVSKLERQAAEAEAKSTEDLIKHADRLEGVDPRFVRAAHKLESERRGAQSRNAAEALKDKADQLDGIDPRLLRAAARLEQAKVTDVPVTGVHEVETLRKEDEAEKEGWRERLEGTTEDSVISFIAPPLVSRSSEVSGFPRTQQRGSRTRSPAPPPAPPAPRGTGRKREPHNHQRALYDDSGETDDESQPTIMVRPSQIPRSPMQLIEGKRLRNMELALPLAIGVLLVGMLILMAVAIATN